MARQTLVALFDDFRQAETAIHEVEALAIPAVRISVVANNQDSRYGRYRTLQDQQSENPGTGEGSSETGMAIGAAAGGGAGLLAGLAALALPGVGPLIAAGSIAFALLGVGAGAAAGGLVGALVGAGVSQAHADIYAEAIRRGGTLIAVEVDDGDRARVSEIIGRHDPVSIEDRQASWNRPAPAIAPPTTASGAPADHGASAGSFTGTESGRQAAPMPTGLGALGTNAQEWEVRREADLAAGREPGTGGASGPVDTRVRAYPAPEQR